MKRTVFFLLLLAAPALFAQSLDQRVDAILPSLLETYQTLHTSPEVSTKEAKTSALVATRLRALGYAVTDDFGTYAEPGTVCHGIVAVLENGKGPTVLLRSDMDALPVTEQTGLPYASQNAGVMHACGHDVHMTTLLGTAKLLADLRSQWSGTVMLIGQPAEEVNRGAAAMLRAGLYERFGTPDYTIAMHDWATLESGKVGYRPGQFMAAIDSVDLTIRGTGGHGAAPQSTKDPVVMAAETIVALQTIVSRERSPLDPVVVTVGKIEGGTKRNIIPDEVRLYLTIRTLRDEVRRRVLESIQRIATGVAMANGVPQDRLPLYQHVDAESGEAIVNDPAFTERLASAIKREIGPGNVVLIDPVMISEDFGLFNLQGKIPSVLLALGAADPAKLAAGTQPGLHSSRFAPYDLELVLRTGIRTEVSAVTDLLAKR